MTSDVWNKVLEVKPTAMETQFLRNKFNGDIDMMKSEAKLRRFESKQNNIRSKISKERRAKQESLSKWHNQRLEYIRDKL